MVKTTPYLFIFRFLTCFFTLYLIFPIYRGVTGVGGRFYCSFLDHHFNVVRGLTTFLTGGAKFLLEVIHYHTVQPDFRTLRIAGSGGVVVNPSCLGWGVMSFWAAFVMANPGKARRKLKWGATGLLCILVLNILRMPLIALAIHLKWNVITSLDHHQTFNLLSYVCILILIWQYLSNQNKYENRTVESE